MTAIVISPHATSVPDWIRRTSASLNGYFQSQQTSVYPETFGATADGATDDSAAIQAAINTGKRVVLQPQKTYAIASGLTVGNGTSSSLSTLNGIVLEGSTSGAAGSEMAPAVLPTRLKWIGATNATMLTVNGPMVGCNISGLVLDCNSVSGVQGIKTNHMISSTWRDVLVTNYTVFAFVHEAYAAFTGLAQGANKNTFINCRAKNPAAGGSGMRVGVTSGYVNGMLDVAQNVWINCEWYRDGTNAGSTSLYLAFCDNCTFIECTPDAQGGTSGVSIYVNPPSGTGTNRVQFPCETIFFNCPTISGFTYDASWAPVSGIIAYPYPIGDGEPLPGGILISGADFNHRYFGNWSLALNSGMTPKNNGDMTIQKTSDTSLTFKVKGSDGVVRSASLTLA